ncbi:hypothetical protein [Bacteriovorax sp. DB6_IX]|uniref:hypothetical protein n=1 Tax=Bacteriovorax sp. DB6_IX TaxID=1353530 RepID=UPI000389FC51|nr:hypothetical protein [Bacteriovorax sp. DB6_IX]EQC51525.1 hypothetical protein M901_0968 [Bacteriovorax sp. DB6_IX]
MNFLKAIITILFLSSTFAQSALDDLSDNSGFSMPTYDLVTEEIIKMSLSKRIYLLSNQSESYARGDFITLLLQQKPIARGLVAKMSGQMAAIKITKIYSMELFQTFSQGMKVQVIRGDDSFYRTKKEEKKEDTLISNEDDLFDETTILDEDLDSEDSNRKEAIKNDNVVSVGYGLVDGYDASGAEAKNQQFNFSWSYQIESNIWIEGLYGQHVIKDFPGATIDTGIKNYTIRAKYALKGPLHTIFLPYIGFQIIDADSPGAGVDADSEEQAQLELSLVENAKDRGVVLGVTALKRLVPGWFIRLEAGTDMLALGLALEF